MMQTIMANQGKNDKRIVELSDFYKALGQRLREQEPKLSEDKLSMNNLPYDPKDGALIRNIINFKTFFNFALKGASFQAFHVLPGKKQLTYCLLPAVKIKIVCFEERNHVSSQRKLVNETKIPLLVKTFLRMKVSLL